MLIVVLYTATWFSSIQLKTGYRKERWLYRCAQFKTEGMAEDNYKGLPLLQCSSSGGRILDELYLDSVTSDISIICDDSAGRSISAHKCILAASSDYFRALFFGKLSYKGSSLKVSYPFEVVKLLVQFIYRGVTSISAENLVVVYEVADYFMLFHLIVSIEEAIMSSLTPSNCCEWYINLSTSTHPSISRIAHRVYEYIRMKITELHCPDHLDRLSVSTMTRLLNDVDQVNDPLVLLNFYPVLVHWSRGQRENLTDEHKGSLLDKIERLALRPMISHFTHPASGDNTLTAVCSLNSSTVVSLKPYSKNVYECSHSLEGDTQPSIISVGLLLSQSHMFTVSLKKIKTSCSHASENRTFTASVYLDDGTLYDNITVPITDLSRGFEIKLVAVGLEDNDVSHKKHCLLKIDEHQIQFNESVFPFCVNVHSTCSCTSFTVIVGT